MSYSSNFVTAAKAYLLILILGNIMRIFLVALPLFYPSIRVMDFLGVIQAYAAVGFFATIFLSIWGILSDGNAMHRLGWGMTNIPYLLPVFLQLLFRPNNVQEALLYTMVLGVLSQLAFYLAVYLIGEPEDLASYLLFVGSLLVTGIMGSLALRDLIPEIVRIIFSVLTLLGNLGFLGILISKADKLLQYGMQLQYTYPNVESI